jgi:uncharacterized membrane protein
VCCCKSVCLRVEGDSETQFFRALSQFLLAIVGSFLGTNSGYLEHLQYEHLHDTVAANFASCSIFLLLKFIIRKT